jgi:hypothetical protein
MGNNFSNLISISQAVARQLGPRPGRQQMVKMFTASEDLPSDEWKIVHEMVYRIGVGRHLPEEVARARKAKGITGRRLWKGQQGNRVVTCWISFFATESDAVSYLPKFVDRSIRKPFSGHSDKVERAVKPKEAPGLVDFSVIHEITYRTPKGAAGERLIAGNVDRIVFGLDFYSPGEMWLWEDIAPVAHRQVERVRSVLPEIV